MHTAWPERVWWKHTRMQVLPAHVAICRLGLKRFQKFGYVSVPPSDT